ncbi:TPM domain-containing protein [Paenibacillus rhizovicinus]|uniref:TPM domain-containing protein n=1 Tax=Paenibacillus rhizovicinus TaxID=2704463 RepID=A0A6C0P1Y7_9BACL|nr:TPM domain-containing protein [Paenibacillus rhizovicinus]QHW31893.1 TPM domain-containing protein [Paenibacillus rhizovicinus]
MRRRRRFAAVAVLMMFVACLTALTLPVRSSAAPVVPVGPKNLIYDQANLLSQQEEDELNALANRYGADRETDIIVYTSNNAENRDVQRLTEDFYDEHGPGYDKMFGNAVILTMDMKNRGIYVAGFGKAETDLDNGRVDKVINAITPDLTRGDYAKAFETYITLTHKYMGFKPGVNPDNILFAIWFQLGAALVVGAIVVGVMVYRSGGRITVNRSTYEVAGTSGVLDHSDQYLRSTVVKSKIERNKGGGSGGGGGGGTSSGGHSHSGGRGSF